MARRFVRSGRRSSGPRRPTFWETASTTALVPLADGGTTASVTAIVSEAELDNVPNPTLVRIRGHVFNRLSTVADALGDCILVAHAIMVVDAKQLAIGVTAMPLPLTDNSEDFLWADSAFLSHGLSSVGGLDGNRAMVNLVIDSKAMRKITLNQVLVMVTEMDVQSGTAGTGMQFGFQLRALLKK